MAEEEEEDEFTILSGSREVNKLNEDPKNEIEENAKQFAIVSLQINLRENDVTEVRELNGLYASGPPFLPPPPQNASNPYAEFTLKSYYNENPHALSTSVAFLNVDFNRTGKLQLTNTTEVAATANIVENDIVLFECYEDIELSEAILGTGRKVVNFAAIDFDQDVKETDLVFPNTKSFTGTRINEYLSNIACTPGSTPWNIGAVATWFLAAGAALPTGMTTTATGNNATYQRSTAAGWYNWARHTYRFSTTPTIGAAVLVGKTTIKNKKPVIIPTNVIGIVQHINLNGTIVVLGATSYILNKYTIPPTEDQIRAAIAAAPVPDIDNQILAFAAAFIARHEGFVANAMWDCNNWRLGAGSERICRKKPDGSALIIQLNSDYTQQPIGWKNTEKTILEFKSIASIAVTPGKAPDSTSNPMVYPYYPNPQKGPDFIKEDLVGPGAAQLLAYSPPKATRVIKTMWHPPVVTKSMELITQEDAFFDLQTRLVEFLEVLKSTSETDKTKFTPVELEYILKKHPYWLVALLDVEYSFGPPKTRNKFKFIHKAKEAAKKDNPDIFYDYLVFNEGPGKGKTDVTYGRIQSALDEVTVAKGLWLTSPNPFPDIKREYWPKEISPPIGPDDVINTAEYMNNFYSKTPLLGMKLTQVTVNPKDIIGYVIAATDEDKEAAITQHRQEV